MNITQQLLDFFFTFLLFKIPFPTPILSSGLPSLSRAHTPRRWQCEADPLFRLCWSQIPRTEVLRPLLPWGWRESRSEFRVPCCESRFQLWFPPSSTGPRAMRPQARLSGCTASRPGGSFWSSGSQASSRPTYVGRAKVSACWQPAFGSLALTFCEWRPWDHARTATWPQSTAGPCWGPCPAHGWLQMGWASGDSCVHYQDTTNSNSRPASFFLWTENVFPLGEDKGQKIRPGPQWGHLLFRACIPGSVGGYTRTHPYTTEAEGLGTDSIFWLVLLFFETSWPCHLSLTLTQSLLACLTWTEGARGDWHLFRSCVCWRDCAQSRPVPCLLSISPGTTLRVYLGTGPRQVPRHSFSVKARHHTYRHLFLFHPTLLSVMHRTSFVSPLIVWLDI